MQQNSFYDVFTSIGHFFKFFTTFFKRIPFIDIPSVRVIFSAKLPISYYRFSQVISWWYIYCSKYICMFKKNLGVYGGGEGALEVVQIQIQVQCFYVKVNLKEGDFCFYYYFIKVKIKVKVYFISQSIN